MKKFIKLFTLLLLLLFTLNQSLISSVSADEVDIPNLEISQEDIELYNSLVTYKDIVYKTVNNNNLTLDILMPTKTVYSKTPVVVFLHGGGWISGHSTDSAGMTRADTMPKLLAQGYAIISVNYSLLDGSTVFPQNICDVKDSIRWIYKNADNYNLDSENIGIWGTSSGAHLSLLAAYSPENVFTDSEDLANYSCKLNYVVDINAPVTFDDPELSISQPVIDGICSLLFGFSYSARTQEQNQIIYEAQPTHYIYNNTVDTLIFHGTEDTTIPISQSQFLHYKLTINGCNSRFIRINGANHGLVPLADYDLNTVTNETINFIKNHYIYS